MGCEVYANGNEIACKAGDNKTLAEFPDVCLSPPSPPAGPIPVPYPNTSFSKDMQNGSKTVQIKGQEVMLKDQSFYKTSPLGNEAATNSFGGSVLTHVITGKTYFMAWSMDVKFEGQNVDRHLDITSSNHASMIGSPPPATPSAAVMALLAMEAAKSAAKHGHKRTPAMCSGKHTWECNKKMCPDCWNPRCEPNAEITEKEYHESQSGTPPEKVKKAKEANARKLAKGEDPVGIKFENDCMDKVGDSNIEHVSYYAHCSVCHTQAQIDIVTKDSVIECKNSAGLLKLNQMNERIVPVAKQCFPGKDIKAMVPATELKAMEKKVVEKEWAPLGIKAVDP